MEAILENVSGAREVFERLMEWQPEEQVWQTYINFELRYKELDRARKIYERFVMTHQEVKNYMKSRFKENHGLINGARTVFERAVELFLDDHMDERLFIAFRQFEENQKKLDRDTTVELFTKTFWKIYRKTNHLISTKRTEFTLKSTLIELELKM